MPVLCRTLATQAVEQQQRLTVTVVHSEPRTESAMQLSQYQSPSGMCEMPPHIWCCGHWQPSQITTRLSSGATPL
eukprot:11890-Heterococcus_DN1.PRE.1